MHLLTHQVAKLKALATTYLSTREGTSLSLPTKERRYQYQGASLPIPIKQQLNLHMRARQLACIQASKLHLALKGNSMFIDNLKLRCHLRPQAPPPSISHPHQLHYQPLMDLGITGFYDLTSANKKYIVSGNKSKTSTLEFSESTS